MQKIITTFLLSLLSIGTFAQTQKKLSTYLSAQYNKTLNDATLGNNPSGVGLGFQTFFTNKSKFKLTIEFTGDIYLEDDKIGRLTPDHNLIDDVPAMINLFGGSSYHPTQNIYLSFLAGPSFIGGKTFLGVKSSLGFFFSNSQKWTVKMSYINIFNRDKLTKEDFGSVSFSLGFKLF